MSTFTASDKQVEITYIQKHIHKVSPSHNLPYEQVAELIGSNVVNISKENRGLLQSYYSRYFEVAAA